MSPSSEAEVLICGAGPTGLVLTLRLLRCGVRIRVVDRAAEPGTTSRALVVHARTLEFYRQMGLAEAFQEQGLPFVALNLWLGSRKLARVDLGAAGEGLSKFPHMVVVTQDRHERFLVDRLRERGVEVERS